MFEETVVMRYPLLLLAALCGSQVLADEPPRSRPVPIEYVSPGASGSVSGSSYSQRHDLYGGHAVPIQGYGRGRVAMRCSAAADDCLTVRALRADSRGLAQHHARQCRFIR